MKMQEIRSMETRELLDKAEEMKKDLLFMRMKASMGQLGNTREIRKVKKDVARVLTALNEQTTEKSEAKE